MPHFNSNSFCWLCRCDRSDATFTDVSATARWRRTILSVERCVEKIGDHPVWDLAGVTRWHCQGGDLMHTGCLGVVAWFLGSVLWELVYDGPFEGSVDRRIKAVWGHIVHWYDELGVKNRLGQLTLEMFKTTGNFACLKGKAAENHQLLPVLRALCSQLGAFSDRDRHRQRALDNLSDIYATFQSAGLRLTEEQVQRVTHAYDAMLLHYNWLTKYSVGKGVLCYNFVGKFHMMWHIIDLSRWMNPTYTWCYAFESYIGHVVRAAQACTAGTAMTGVSKKVAENAALALHLDILGNSEPSHT